MNFHFSEGNLLAFHAKVPFFFSREKFKGHSLTQNEKKSFFFSENWKKKKKTVLFFFPGKVYKSLTQFFLAHIFLLIYKGVYTHGFFAGRGKGHSVL